VWLAVLAVLAALGQCRGLRRSGGGSAPSAVRCYSGAELGAEAPEQLLARRLRWDRHVSVQLVPQLERLEAGGARRQRRHRPPACPALSLRAGLRSEPHERSISPWRYRIDEDENRYPRKLAFAECLCSGCVDVKTGRETSSLNSVTIHQTMLVLRRKPCPRPAGLGLVTLEVDYIRVPVGCTCVLPRTAS
ncbi:PREDICTED: interleukin-17C, partial [Pseudopodoces humilis]|uniref:interleukin-17C n=1 Tax=Pseudopodoces humilis TaxID=181119 RepID=UPI000395A604